MKILFFLIFNFAFILGCSSKPKSYEGHGGESVSPRLLKKFAPQKTKGPNLSRIESLLDIRSPSGGVLSEDGKALYFNWNVTGQTQVWKMNGPQSFPIQLTGGQDSASVNSITTDGKFIIVSRDVGGSEYPGLYLMATAGGPLKQIYKKPKVKVWYQYTSDDSKYIYYGHNEKGPKTYTFERYHIPTGKKEELFVTPEGTWFISSHIGNEILLTNYKGNTSVEIFQLNWNDKKLKPLLGQGEDVEYQAVFGMSANQIIVRTNKFGNFHNLYEFKKNKFTPITKSQKFDIGRMSSLHKRKRLIYTVNENGYYKVKVLNLSNLKPTSLKKFSFQGALQQWYGRSTRNGNYTNLTVEKHNAPRLTYVYSWKKGLVTQWSLPSTPEIDVSSFQAPTLEYYPARDGTQIPMFVRRPPECQSKVCPVVVRFHGGPESQAIPYFSPMTELYLEKGFIFVEPNVRGSRGYGKEWLNSDNGPKRLDVITDIEDAARFIRKSWSKKDQSPKVGIIGGSYGGYSAFVGMTLFAGAFDAGVAVVGMSDLVSFLKNTAPYRRHLRTSEYGDPEKDLEALKKLSPINYLDQIKDPILIVHGANDPRVPAGEAIQIFNAMKEKGLPGELILFADEGHGVRKRKNRAIYYSKIFDFFEKYLK